MIRSFRSSALKRFWVSGDTSEIAKEWHRKIEMRLDRLNAAEKPSDMKLPGFGFHALKGPSKGRYAVKVSANYLITFAWDDKDAVDVHLEDYH